MVGLDNLDRVIRIIREASSNATASAALKNGKLPCRLFIPLHIALLMAFLINQKQKIENCIVKYIFVS